MRKLQTQLTAVLLSTLSLLTGAQGQASSASSTQSLPSTPLQRKLAQVREHAGETAAADKQSPSPTTRLDHAALDPASRDRIRRAQARHKAVPQFQRLPG